MGKWTSGSQSTGCLRTHAPHTPRPPPPSHWEAALCPHWPENQAPSTGEMHPESRKCGWVPGLKVYKITRLAFENFRNITLKKTHKLYALVNAWLGLWGGWRGPGGEVTLKLMPE